MVELISATGAVLTWLGAATLVLLEGRRAGCAGLLLVTTGLSLAAASIWSAQLGLAFLAGGGALSAVATLLTPLRPAEGPTTPRILLSLLGGAAAIWTAFFILDAPGGRALRGALLSVLILLGASVAGGARRANLAQLAAALALAGGAATLGQAGALPSLFIAGAAAAAITVLAAARARPAAPARQ